jgi:ribosomal protein L20
MARGWESKSVESQIESAKDGITSGSGQQSTDNQKKVQRERQGLLLSRTYLLRRIESCSNERYTQSLRQALEEIDRKIAKLDGQ